jgi:hypothetical protein
MFERRLMNTDKYDRAIFKGVLSVMRGLPLTFEEIEEVKNLLLEKSLEARQAQKFSVDVDCRRTIEDMASECGCETVDSDISDRGFRSALYGPETMEMCVLMPREKTQYENLETEVSLLGYRFATVKEFLSLVAQHGDSLRGYILALFQGSMSTSVYQKDWKYVYLEADENKRSLKLTKLGDTPDEFLVALVKVAN